MVLVWPLECSIYCQILLSHKKEWNFAICSREDGLGEYYAKWNKSKKGKTVWYHIYVESKLPQISKYNKKEVDSQI